MYPALLPALQAPPVLPIDLTEVIAVTMGTLMFIIPIAAFSLRYAIKPVAEALAKMRESTLTNETIQMLERRVTLLEQETMAVAEVRKELRDVRQAIDFERQLGKGGRPPAG